MKKIFKIMFETIKSWFKDDEILLNTPRKNAKIFKIWEHNTWGDKIGWMDVEKGTICGFLSYPNEPKKGDILLAKMQSGKIGEFIFGEIDWCGNPHDMFFSTVYFSGYNND